MAESPRQEANSGTDTRDKESSVCPTCGQDDFNTKRGMHIHHSTIHGESLVLSEKECPECGSTFESYNNQEYCSVECNIESQRSGNVETCGNCGCEFEAKPAANKKYCSKNCYTQDQKGKMAGENHPQYTENVILECDYCGSKYEEIPSREERSSFCSKECRLHSPMPENHPFTNHGEDHPAYKNGHTHDYGHTWWKARQKTLERDGYECVVCGKSKSDIGRNPHVHHIKPIKSFEDPNDANTLTNLVTLCPKHHKEWEGLYLRPDTRQ